MSKKLKISLIIIALILIFFGINVEKVSALSWDETIQAAKNFEKAGQSANLIDSDKVIDTIVPLGQMLTSIGVAVLFGAVILLGVKYMKAQPEERGKLKQQLVGLVISGIVIFGAFTIWRIAYNFFKEIF